MELIPDCCSIVPTRTPSQLSIPATALTPNLAVTQTLIPTNTATNTSISNFTSTPANPIPTETPTLISQSDLPDYFISDCIAYGIWYFWKGEIQVSTYENEQKRRCYDLTDMHFSAQKKEPNSSSDGLRINIDSQGTIMNGIFLPLDKETRNVKLSLNIEKLVSGQKCKDNENCDVNLIIGFGEPVYGSGWFLVYRSTTKDSKVSSCLIKSAYDLCYKLIKEETGDIFLNHDLEFTLNGQDLYISIDGNIYPGPSVANMQRKLWIGYLIRQTGAIKVFFQFK